MNRQIPLRYPADFDREIPLESQKRPASAQEIRANPRQTRQHKPLVFYELANTKFFRPTLTSSSESLRSPDKWSASSLTQNLPETPQSLHVVEEDFVFSPVSSSVDSIKVERGRSTPTTSIGLQLARTVGTVVSSSFTPVLSFPIETTTTTSRIRKQEGASKTTSAIPVTITKVKVSDPVTVSTIPTCTSFIAGLPSLINKLLPIGNTTLISTSGTTHTTVTTVIDKSVITPVATTALPIVVSSSIGLSVTRVNNLVNVTSSGPINTIVTTASGTTTVTTSVSQAVVSSSSSGQNLNIPMAEPINIAPMPFRGAPGESALDWLSMFAKYCVFKGVNDDRKKALFSLMMQGTACDWLDGLTTEQTASYAEMEKAFKERYGMPDCVKFKSVSNIFTRRQADNETINDFVTNVQKLAKENGLDDNMTMYAILNGLKPKIAPWVTSKSPKTIQEIIEHGRVAEAMQTSPTSDTSILQSLVQQVQELGQKVERQHVRSVSRSPTPTRGRRVTFKTPTETRPAERRDNWSRRNGGQRPNYNSRQTFTSNGRGNWSPNGSGAQAANRCLKCNQARHVDYSHCKALNARCFVCSKVGHLAICCWQKGGQNRANGSQNRPRRGGYVSTPTQGTRSD